MTDDIIKAADKETQTRLDNISAVTGNVNKLRAEMNTKLKALENKNTTITNLSSDRLAKINKDVSTMQKGMSANTSDIKAISNQKGVKEIQTNVSSMLGSMSKSVAYMADGVKKTTLASAQASRDMIGNYSKAISEDISINKQNTVAMAMAKSSPLFGYFASKFMETDVYSNFTDKIKSKFSEATKEIAPMLSGLFRQGFEKIKDLRYMFARKPKIEWSEDSLRAMGDRKASIRGIGEKLQKKNLDKEKKKIPKLAKGGIIKSSGLAKVHKGEVVMSVDELLEKMGAKVEEASEGGPKLTNKLIRGLTVLTENQATMEHYVGVSKTKKKGIVGDFLEAYKEAKNVEDQKWQDRLLKAVLELKVSLVGTTNRMQLAWQETLVKHPMFRNAIALSKFMKAAFDAPLRFLFTSRGGYLGEIKRATRNKNVFINIVSALSLMYAKWSLKFDTMISIMNDQLVSAGGKKRKGSTDKTTTRWDQLKSFASSKEKTDNRSLGEKLFSMYSDSLGLSKENLKEAGIHSFKDLLSPKKAISKTGVTPDLLKKKIDAYMGEGISAAKGTKEKATGMYNKMRKKPPPLATGGFIKKTGKILAHKGELILPVKEVFIMIRSFSESTLHLAKSLKPIESLKSIFEELKASVEDIAPKVAKAASDVAQQTASTIRTQTIKAYEAIKEYKPISRIKDRARLAKDAASSKFESMYETAEKIKNARPGKTPFKMSMPESMQGTNMATSLMGFFQKLLQKRHDVWMKRRMAKESKWEKKIEKQKVKAFKKQEKLGKKTEKFERKQAEKTQRRWYKWWDKSDKKREKAEEKHNSFFKKAEEYSEKLRLNSINKVERMKEWFALRTMMKQNKIFKKGQRAIEILRDETTKKIYKYQTKTDEKILKDQTKIADQHKKAMKRLTKWQQWAENREKNKQDAFMKMQDRMRKKELKQRKKIQKIEDKMKKEELKFEQKIAAMKAKAQTSAEKKLAKEEMKLKLLEAKQDMKERRKQAKIEMIAKKAEFKEKRVQFKKDMAAKKKSMKERTAQMKVEMKERKAAMKERMKVIKAERKAKGKEMWAKRWKRVTDFPREVQKANAAAKKRHSKHMSKLNIQISQLSKVRKFTTWMGEKFPTFTKYIKKAWGGIGKWIMLGMGFLQTMFGRVFSMLGPILGAIPGLAVGAIGVLKGATGLGAGVGAGALAAGAAGVGGLTWGGMDAYKGTKKAKKWGTSKTAAGIGGFLGGTTDRRKGLKGAWDMSKDAAKGTAKGAMIGAGIGSIVPGFGTAIGAAVGAVAGGILGAVGGKDIAKGMQYMAKQIKKLALSVWHFITFPQRMVLKFMKKAKEKLMVVWDNMWATYETEGVTGVVKYLSSLAWWIIKKIGTSIWNIRNKVTDWINAFLQDKFFPAMMSGFNKLVKEPFMKVRTSIFNFLAWPFNKIQQMLNNAREYISEKLSAIPGVGRFLKGFVKPKKDDDTMETKVDNAKVKKLNKLKGMMTSNAFALLGGDPEAFKTLFQAGKIIKTSEPFERPMYSVGIETKAADALASAKGSGIRVPSLQSGGFVDKTGLVKVHAGEVVGEPGQVIDRLITALSSSELARIEAGQELTKAKVTAGPIISAQEKTQAELSKGNKAVINNIVSNTSAVAANTSAVSNIASQGDSGGGRSNNDYTMRIIEGDIG